jgi:hypothetical protein
MKLLGFSSQQFLLSVLELSSIFLRKLSYFPEIHRKREILFPKIIDYKKILEPDEKI